MEEDLRGWGGGKLGRRSSEAVKEEAGTGESWTVSGGRSM